MEPIRLRSDRASAETGFPVSSGQRFGLELSAPGSPFPLHARLPGCTGGRRTFGSMERDLSALGQYVVMPCIRSISSRALVAIAISSKFAIRNQYSESGPSYPHYPLWVPISEAKMKGEVLNLEATSEYAMTRAPGGSPSSSPCLLQFRTQDAVSALVRAGAGICVQPILAAACGLRGATSWHYRH